MSVYQLTDFSRFDTLRQVVFVSRDVSAIFGFVVYRYLWNRANVGEECLSKTAQIQSTWQKLILIS